MLLAAACGSDPGGDGPDAGPRADADITLTDAAPLTPDATVGGPCDPIAQTGCAENQKCSVIPGEDTSTPPKVGCVANTGMHGLRQACTRATATSPDNCLRGTACVGNVAPRCMEFCSSDPTDTCSGNQACAISVDFDGDFRTDVKFCAERCSTLSQDCSSAIDACYPSSQDDVCLLEGAGDTPVGEGETCDYANSCAAGHGCFRLGVSPDWLCFKMCDPGGGSPGCSGGKVCNPVENETWGICINPA